MVNNFNDLCYLLDKITTPKEARNEIAIFLKDLSIEEQIITCNFLLGQPIENKKIGYSAKTVQNVLFNRYGVEHQGTKSLGDVFLTVKESKHSDPFLSLTKIYKMYGDLFTTSSGKEQTLYLKLLDLPPNQQRWFINIMLDKLQVRLGFTVLKHSLAEVYNVDVKDIEFAWNRTHSMTKTIGYLNDEEIDFKIGVPIPSQLARDISKFV